MAPAPPVEEGKLLADALSTVKIQVVQMKRHLVSHHHFHVLIECELNEREFRMLNSSWML